MKSYIQFCLFVLLITAGYVVTADEVEYHEESYVLGYVSAVIEYEFKWDAESYDIVVNNDVVMLTLIQQVDETSDELAQRKQRATRELPLIAGVSTVDTRIVTLDATVPVPGKIQADDSSALSLSREGVSFPTGNPFRPLLADPKEPRFLASLRQYETRVGNTTVGAVGFGEHIAFYKWPDRESGDGLQIGISAGVFAQFDMDARSSDLINADYVVGFPLSYRRGSNSVRLRLYHQSSHLGDEFLINRRPERINLSYESLELLYAHVFGQWRPYVGGEYLVHRDPEDLEPSAVHAGLEFRSADSVWRSGKFVAGLDLKSWEEHDWEVDRSLKFGIDFGELDSGKRRLKFLAEAYKGFSPHGQFFEEEVEYYGAGVYFGF